MNEDEIRLKQYKEYFSEEDFITFKSIILGLNDEWGDRSIVEDSLIDYAKKRPENISNFLNFIHDISDNTIRVGISIYPINHIKGRIEEINDKFISVLKDRTNEINQFLSKIKRKRTKELISYRLWDVAEKYPENVDAYLKKVGDNIGQLEQIVSKMIKKVGGDNTDLITDNFISCIGYTAIIHPNATEFVINKIKNLNENNMNNAEYLFSPIVSKNAVPAILLADIYGINLIEKGKEVWNNVLYGEISPPIDLLAYIDNIAKEQEIHSNNRFEIKGAAS